MDEQRFRKELYESFSAKGLPEILKVRLWFSDRTFPGGKRNIYSLLLPLFKLMGRFLRRVDPTSSPLKIIEATKKLSRKFFQVSGSSKKRPKRCPYVLTALSRFLNTSKFDCIFVHFLRLLRDNFSDLVNDIHFSSLV